MWDWLSGSLVMTPYSARVPDISFHETPIVVVFQVANLKKKIKPKDMELKNNNEHCAYNVIKWEVYHLCYLSYETKKEQKSK